MADSEFETELSKKSTKELKKMREYLMKNHEQARQALDPGDAAKREDSIWDEHMKTILARVRKIDSVLDERE
jgi:hypothetical protein